MPMLSEIDFASFNSYHEIPLHDIDWSEAESHLTDERKKYLRTTAKEKAGQAAGAGALSSVAKNVYSRLVKQAAVKQLWKEKHESDVDNDDDPLTDVEYGELASQPGTSQRNQQQSAVKGTPPPGKKRKQGEQEEQQNGQQEEEEYQAMQLW